MQNRVKELREEKKMTQLRLSFELGVAQETVSAYETGKHYPSVKSLLIMADLFQASLDYIMGRSHIRMPVEKDGLSGGEAAALLLFRTLNPTQKEKATAYMQGMLE